VDEPTELDQIIDTWISDKFAAWMIAGERRLSASMAYAQVNGAAQELKQRLKGQPTKKPSGGPPEKYPWEDLWFEIIRKAIQSSDPDPPNRATLRKWVDEFISQNWAEHPTDPYIRAKVGKLDRVLRQR
jgi:hypothetical protein